MAANQRGLALCRAGGAAHLPVRRSGGGADGAGGHAIGRGLRERALAVGAAGRLFDRMLAASGAAAIHLSGGLELRAPPSGRFDAAGSARCGEIAAHHVRMVAPKWCC
jgi:hypothetical protein